MRPGFPELGSRRVHTKEAQWKDSRGAVKSVMEYSKSIPVVVFDSTSPGRLTEWRRAGMDKQLYGFLINFKNNALTRSKDDPVRRMHLNTACHVPATFKLFEKSVPDVESAILNWSFQVHEDCRRDEEEFAPSGWQVCSFVAEHQSLLKDKGIEPSSDEIETAILGTGKADSQTGVTFAPGSDYQIKKGNRKVDDMILIHRRISAVPGVSCCLIVISIVVSISISIII